MAGLTKNKLCCTLNAFVEGSKRTYCKDCYSDVFKEILGKQVDWDQVAHWIKDATEEFITDTHHCDSPIELMECDHEDVIDGPFEESLEQTLGSEWADNAEKYEQAIQLAHEIRWDFITAAQNRVKIVVE